MRLHNRFAIRYSDFCKLYPRGMLSLSVWCKRGVQDAAREDHSRARRAPSPPAARLWVVGSKIKAYGSHLPPVPLALIIFNPTFPPTSIHPHQGRGSGLVDSTRQTRAAGASGPPPLFNRPQETSFSRVITGQVLLSHP